jgi:sulfite oxidase
LQKVISLFISYLILFETGARLSDILKEAGYQPNDTIKHVHLNGAEGYGASIPIEKALNPKGDVILAYEMNGEPVPIDHGYPLRVLVPGHVAARSVKWLNSISLSDEESPSHWQQRDYKGFSPSATLETSDYSKAQSIQEMPVQSAIISPKSGDNVSLIEHQGQKGFFVKGYAWSGGGRGINRVDISSDGGQSWKDAELQANKKQEWGQQWAWTKWETFIPVSKDQKELEIVCKAVDSAYQVQPESMLGIYNVRGVLVNAWQKIKVKLDESP